MALWLSLYNLPNSCFLPNSSRNLCNQIISLLASIAATYSASIVESATTLCSFETQLIAIPTIVTHTLLCSSCYLYHLPYFHQHIPVEQCLNLQSIMLDSWYLSDTLESTSPPSNVIFLDCSCTCVQLPLHVQYQALCRPLHTLSFQLLMHMEL